MPKPCFYQLGRTQQDHHNVMMVENKGKQPQHALNMFVIAYLNEGPTGSVLSRKLQWLCPAAPTPVTARSTANTQKEGAARLANMEAMMMPVATNRGLRRPQRSQAKPKTPEPTSAPMNINCRNNGAPKQQG
jgi:hypothetical protein